MVRKVKLTDGTYRDETTEEANLAAQYHQKLIDSISKNKKEEDTFNEVGDTYKILDLIIDGLDDLNSGKSLKKEVTDAIIKFKEIKAR